MVPNPFQALDAVVLVLYQPQDVVNVAAAIRAMSNFGLRRLRLVEPAAYDPHRIEGIAHKGAGVVGAVERYPTLEAALGGCGLVAATTARPRQFLRERLTPRQAAPALLAAAADHAGAPPAIVFGREDSGLPNSAIDQCHAIITIPTHADNPSLNLAQAVLVVAYELWLAASARPAAAAAPARPAAEAVAGVPGALSALAAPGAPAAGTDRETMFATLDQLLRALYPTTTDERMAYAMARLRAVLLRAVPRGEEARMLTHLFRHMTRLARRAGTR